MGTAGDWSMVEVLFDFSPFTFHPITKAPNAQVSDTTGDAIKHHSRQQKKSPH